MAAHEFVAVETDPDDRDLGAAIRVDGADVGDGPVSISSRSSIGIPVIVYLPRIR